MASSSSPDEQRDQEELREQPQAQAQPDPEPVKECIYKTKLIQFLGRTVPIVLQNENGPCPLLAICNVLLLRNHLNLNPELTDVSQEKLLSLVAERLIDSNSNVDNKDAGYVKNQQQNIADAIDLLPRLATGIDVNVKFRRIDDFEFTPECAIFDLLDIPLYHGWIVDPQDQDTADAIGSKSYNALMGELVFLETKNMDGQQKDLPAEDSVDFVAATTATLGVPSPSLSKARSFDDSPHSASDKETFRKGDLEEEAELLRALKLSEADAKDSVSNPTGTSNLNAGNLPVDVNEPTSSKEATVVGSVGKLENGPSGHTGNSCALELSLEDGCNSARTRSDEDVKPAGEFNVCFKIDEGSILNQSNLVDCSLSFDSNDKVGQSTSDPSVYIGNELPLPAVKSVMPSVDSHADVARVGDKICHEDTSESSIQRSDNMEAEHMTSAAACLETPNFDSDLNSSSGNHLYNDGPETLTSDVDGGEPIYEGEECVLKTGAPAFENREPVYEGEVVLAEQNDKSTSASSDTRPKDEISPQQGELIRNFLKNTASQLTFYGLFCLQEGLKERELCVFFRNNHFSTMFKFDGELYLLATDQGYINQSDLVWEKLNEVNGDTLFMTGNFKEFKVESNVNHTWDENNAVASTADYLASIGSAAQGGLDINNDLQLAIALQQQEFEQQPQRHTSQQPATTGSSRLITGPQVARSSVRQPSSTSRPETKSKDRCNVM